ncbi:MAG: trypsin-like peptidase domain-containing protein [Sedimenticola sp.]
MSKLHGVLILLLTLPSWLCWGAEPSLIRIGLKNGTVIEAPLLMEKHNWLLLDLGFDILKIPQEQVADLQDKGSSLSTQETGIQHSGLYTINSQPPQRSDIKKQVKNTSEAVLRVRTPTGLGSGFLIQSDGYVVTNHHVIDGEHEITLTLFEKGKSELRPILFDNVRIVALSPHLDLALLKIEGNGGKTLPVLTLGDSHSLVQGENVFSIGSPLGFDRTVSQGIISLRNRPMDGQLYLQSTVQINPGNSGGPLFNLRGEVVGVNNMKIQAVGIEGLSFAIPANRLRVFLDNIDAYAFDARNTNNGYRYNAPMAHHGKEKKGK